MYRGAPLLLVLFLSVATCDGGGGASPADAPVPAADTAPDPDTPSTDDTGRTPPPSCDSLLLNNAGIPGNYPFTLGDDVDRKSAAQATLAALSDAYGVETIQAPSLASFTYTPSWQTTFDLTPMPGASDAEELEGLLEAFLAKGTGLFAFENATAGDDSGAETDTGHFRFRYTQTYCGGILANATVAEGGHPRGTFAGALQWTDRGVLVADLRKDGLIQSFTDLLVPALVHAPTKPVISADAAAAALVGERLEQQGCFGAGGHVLTESELGEVGDPVFLLLEAADGLQLHLAWPVGVYLEGTTTAYVDALTGVPLGWALHFPCN
ncbi:MAG: hypothetical protein ABIK09_08175 [Pseudomonadota bacterium]